MKSKKILTILAATVLAVVIVFSSTAIAAPTVVQSFLNVIIRNEPGTQDVPVIVNDQDPVDVAITGEVEINDETPINIDGTVIIDDQDPVDVTVDGTVPADVSGWLHTTKSDKTVYSDLEATPEGSRYLCTIDTAGYRQITLVFTGSFSGSVPADTAKPSIRIEYSIDGRSWAYQETATNIIPSYQVTLDVVSDQMLIEYVNPNWNSNHFDPSDDTLVNVEVAYFLMT